MSTHVRSSIYSIWCHRLCLWHFLEILTYSFINFVQKHIKEAKEILEIIGKKPIEDMQNEEDTLKAYIDIAKDCLEAFT